MDGFVTKKGELKTFLCFYSLWKLDLLVRVTEHVRQLYNRSPETPWVNLTILNAKLPFLKHKLNDKGMQKDQIESVTFFKSFLAEAMLCWAPGGPSFGRYVAMPK